MNLTEYKKRKKKKDYLGSFYTLGMFQKDNAGDVEKNNQFFNDNTGTSSSDTVTSTPANSGGTTVAGGMGEELGDKSPPNTKFDINKELLQSLHELLECEGRKDLMTELEDKYKNKYSFDSITQQPKITKLRNKPTMKLKEDFEETLNFRTIEDIIAGMVDNAEDDIINYSLRIFKRIGKEFGVDDYNNITAVVVDSEYDPVYYDFITDSRHIISSKHGQLDFYKVDDVDIIREEFDPSQVVYLYFRNDDDAVKYFNRIDKENNGEVEESMNLEEEKNDFEYVIWKEVSETENPIVAVVKNFETAQHKVNTLEKSGDSFGFEKVPVGRFKVGDDFTGPFDETTWELTESVDPDFEPFFFKDEDGDWFRDEAESYLETLDVTDYVDAYDSFRDFVDNEFSIKVLGSIGNKQEMDELYKYFILKAPKQAKIGFRIWGDDDLTESVEDKFEEERLTTPRGTFRIYKGSWEDFKNEDDAEDWGFWFDAYYPENADWEHTEKWYKIMHNYKKQHAVAVLYQDKTKNEELTEDYLKSHDYIGNAMILDELPKIGHKSSEYGFGYQNSVVFNITYEDSVDGYDIFKVWCKDNIDDAFEEGYHYSIAIKQRELKEDLIQSDSEEAFKKNVKTEIEAGKPKDQALAIAYSVKEKNMKEDFTTEEDAERDNEFIQETAKYIFNLIIDDCLGRKEIEIDDRLIPTYDEIIDEWDDRVTKKQYNESVRIIKSFNGFHIYKPHYNEVYLELNDNHTLYEIDNELVDLEYFGTLVQDALEQFEEQTGVEVFTEGRSGRHIVVNLTYENCYHYDELKDVQRELEQQVIDEANAFTGFDEDEEVSTNWNSTPDRIDDVSVDNLEECLNRIDNNTYNKYDLLNTYYMANLTEEKTNKLVEALKANKPAQNLYKLLVEDCKDLNEGVMKNIAMGIEDAGGVDNRVKELEQQINELKDVKGKEEELKKLKAELEVVKEHK